MSTNFWSRVLVIRWSRDVTRVTWGWHRVTWGWYRRPSYLRRLGARVATDVPWLPWPCNAWWWRQVTWCNESHMMVTSGHLRMTQHHSKPTFNRVSVIFHVVYLKFNVLYDNDVVTRALPSGHVYWARADRVSQRLQRSPYIPYTAANYSNKTIYSH